MSKETKEVCNVPDKILETLQKDVAEIKVALLGNEYNPTGGLLYRVNEMEKEVEKIRMKYERIFWTAGGAAAALTLALNVIMYFFDKFILK